MAKKERKSRADPQSIRDNKYSMAKNTVEEGNPSESGRYVNKSRRIPGRSAAILPTGEVVLPSRNNEATRNDGNENSEISPHSTAEVGRPGACFPYNDFFVMSSQILAIMATCFLWINTRTLLMSVFAMVMHQIVVWSYHMEKMAIRTLPVVSILAALAFFSHGMITLGMLILEGIDEEEYSDEGCRVGVDVMMVAFFAFMGGLFWMGSYLCMSSFVERGRNAQWHALVLAASESERGNRRESEMSAVEIFETERKKKRDSEITTMTKRESEITTFDTSEDEGDEDV
mmetsp:Transcript_12060/g.24888  ORF Transcript_12060/g.24888 Transcript_12060/m.24888 type:complete len:287 (-) Transcript_12060:202-1062(-)